MATMVSEVGMHSPRVWGKFNWEDPMALDSLLTEEERMIQETARQYAQEKLMPRIIESYNEEKEDPDIIPEMGELGLLGPTILFMVTVAPAFLTFHTVLSLAKLKK